ncbi:liver-expressed antimicrobial peptide 2 [Genypterus blacodes]|uniref:liver-expressed antimicrobial peptide 2 n=1 Tax=Genypterus blacodes TaxID=154954 RepID=UPI003F75E731
MWTLQQKIILLSTMLMLIYAVQVNSMPVREDWNNLIQRTKRSLLWRWNSLKPVGSSCRDHAECGTQYCRKKVCSFWRAT